MENRRIIIGGSRINRRGTTPSPASHASHTSDRETPLLSDSTTNPKVPTLQPKPKSGTGPIVVASSLPRTKHATAPSVLSGTDDEAALLLLLRALVTLGADSTTHGSALHHAARSDRTAGCIPLLVQRNEASSPRSKVDSFASVANDRGQTPLHWAAYGNAVDAVCSLLEAGADVSATDKQGLTPMHVAAARGAVAVVKALLRDNGTVPLTDVLASRTFLALTPLHLAAEAGHSHVLALLLAHATDATMVARDPLGRNILHLAALGGHTRAVAAISSSPADVRLLHVVDDRGATPTCLAAALRHTDTLIHLIMRFGPDIADIPDTLAAHMNVDAIADVALLPLLGWKLDDDVVAGNAGDDNDDNDDNDDDEDFLDDEFRLDAAIHVLDLSLQRGWLRLVKLFVQHGVRPSRDGVSRATKEAAALLGDVAAVESEASRSPTIATIDLRPRAPLSVATRTSSGAHPPTPPPTPKARPEPPSGPRPERKTTGEMRAMLFGKDEKEKEKEKEKERERERDRDRDSKDRDRSEGSRRHRDHRSGKSTNAPAADIFALCVAGRDSDLLEAVRTLPEGTTVSSLRDDARSTPLHAAAAAGHVRCVRVLLKARVRLSGANRSGETAMHLAARAGHVDVVRELIRAASSGNKQPHRVVNATTKRGAGVLHYAVAAPAATASAIMRQLLALDGVAVNSANRRGETPLHAAASAGAPVAVVAALLRAGADGNAVDERGNTPAATASRADHSELANLLLNPSSVELLIDEEPVGPLPDSSPAISVSPVRQGAASPVRELSSRSSKRRSSAERTEEELSA
eukprot:CAMPEP_0170749688 /NCGR_PEP_ID=MMETSP0437-20130122/10526_1 /TAXON_ID=0 /ORGANISM="Sexangularia sp." /LENGTH=806 /DNA_ID=CAMNT_0011088623 /DNA_START=1 /DNA_END=2418 /DNA_ORIENTATION=+